MTTTEIGQPDTREVVGACPVDCPDTCSWHVTVQGDVPVKLRASKSMPFTDGQLCVKLNSLLDHRLHPDRVLYPLRRIGAKGEGRFERVTWDDAFTDIAARLREIIDRRGAAAIWPYWSTGTLGQVQGYGVGNRLWNLLGTARHLSTICTRAGTMGTVAMLGAAGGHDPEQIERARAIILWGANPAVTGHHLWPIIERARKRGAQLIVIDPIRTMSAERADRWLAIRPGSDAALAHTVARLLVEAGHYDRDWVAKRANGFDDYAAYVSTFDLAEAMATTGLSEEEIRLIANVLATARPTAVRIGIGLQRHAGGGAAVQAITALSLLTGDTALPGGGPMYVTTGLFPWNEAAVQGHALRTADAPQLHSTRLGTNLAAHDDQGRLLIEAMWFMNANPAASNPDQSLVRPGLAREDLFTVVVDHFVTDTADFADYVLPATMQPEHDDLHGSYGHLYVTRNDKAVEPPGECLPNSEIIRRLATALGVTEPSVFDDDATIAAAALSGDRPAFAGVADSLARDGWARLDIPPAPFADGFPTPDGRANLWPLSTASPRSASEPDAGGLRLLTTATRHFVNTLFGNSPAHQARHGVPGLAIHPADADARGITDGDCVAITNDRGCFHLIARVTDGVRPGVVAASKGLWPKLTGGNSANAATREHDADFGGAIFHDTTVEVHRVTTER